MHYAVSGDGNYITTLSTKGQITQLNIWDLELYSSSVVVDGSCMDDRVERRAPFKPEPCGSLDFDSGMCEERIDA